MKSLQHGELQKKKNNLKLQKGFGSIVVLLHIIEFSCACNAVLNFEHRFKFEREMSSKERKPKNPVFKFPNAESLSKICQRIYRLGT